MSARALREYQNLAIDYGHAHPRFNLHAGMGLGKTASTLTLLKELASGEPALVVAPLRVARGVWPVEVREWDHLQGFKIETILGTVGERREALRRPAHLHTINYDNLPWLVAEFGSPERWPFKTVVADESTRLKGYRSEQGTMRAGSLRKIAHRRIARWINLTGTPAPNGLQDLWGQQWFIDGGAALGRSFEAFKMRWFYSQSRDTYAQWQPFKHAHEEIVTAMQPTTLTIDAKDWFDVKEPIVTNIYVDLPESARKGYRKMAREFFAELSRGTVTAATAGVKSLKLLQFASGAVYHDDHTWSPVHDEKIEALRSVLEESAGAPVLVVYEFKHEMERIQKAFPHTRAIKRTDHTFETDWNAGRVPLAIGHPKSFGHGLNLQHGGNIIVYFGQSWDLELYLQALDRIGPVRQIQSGYDRPVFVYHIVARDTLDEQVVARRLTKASVMDTLRMAMKAQ